MTSHNKQAFVKKYVQWTLVGSRTAALLAIREGFHWFGEEVNRHLRILTWRDVKLLLSGIEHLEPSIVLDRLQFEGFGARSSTPAHLRQVIQAMDSEMLSRFLSFVTAQESLPLVSTPKPIKVILLGGGDSRLPISHACFWQLDLPDFSNVEALRERLMLALEDEGTFTMH